MACTPAIFFFDSLFGTRDPRRVYLNVITPKGREKTPHVGIHSEFLDELTAITMISRGLRPRSLPCRKLVAIASPGFSDIAYARTFIHLFFAIAGA